MAKRAVVVSCHGTVEQVEDIPAFVTNIRRGRPAPPEVVAEVTARFQQIGGSPLMRITHDQARALEARLGLPVRACARLWHPYPEAVLAELAAEGVTEVVSLPLAPQSVHVYNEVVEKAAAEQGMTTVAAPSYGEEPSLVAAFVSAIEEARARFTPAEQASLAVILSAHSLPTRVIAMGDPYEKDFRAMAEAVAAALPIPRASIHVAFQSQGMGGGDWLGPDLETTMRGLRDAGIDNLLMAPIGFVAEHVETLYDIDIEARGRAEAMGFARMERMPAMDCRPAFIDALAEVATRLLAG